MKEKKNYERMEEDVEGQTQKCCVWLNGGKSENFKRFFLLLGLE